MIRTVDLRDVSIANLTVGRVPPVQLIEDTAAAGCGAVGLLLMTATPQPLEHGVVGKPEVVREIKAALKSTGLRVFDIEAFVLSPRTDFATFRPALEVGAELGATHISSVGTQYLGNTEFLEPAQRVDMFGKLCEEAAAFGLHVGVEFMLYRDIRTWQEALGLVEAAGQPNAGLIVDVLHFFRAGANPVDLATVPADRIAYLQLCDAVATSPALDDLPTEARGARLHLGDGVAPLNAMLDVIPEGTQVVIETPVAAELGWSSTRRAVSSAEHARRFFEARAAASKT